MQRMVTGILLMILGAGIGLYGAYASSSRTDAGKANTTHSVKGKDGASKDIVLKGTNSRHSTTAQNAAPAGTKPGQSSTSGTETRSATGSATATAPVMAQDNGSMEPSMPQKPKDRQAIEPPKKVVVYFARGSRHVSTKNRKRLESLPSEGWAYDILVRCGDADTRDDARELCKKRVRALERILNERGVPRKSMHVKMEVPRDPKSDPKYTKARWRRAIVKPRRSR